MRINVPHQTTQSIARERVERHLGDLLAQHGHRAQNLEHEWSGNTVRFKGKANGLALEGSVEVTDQEIIIDAKLPLIAKPFEGKIRAAIEKEADSMFRMA